MNYNPSIKTHKKGEEIMRTKDLANGLAYFTDELEFRTDDLIKAINAISSGEDEKTTADELHNIFLDLQSVLERIDKDFEECFNG
tara:strand:+ start:465 stop:719 length:255 start_codon:yes stop_codon:yes gene_type:complete